ncbi:hypothetical protein TNCV_1999181 [Trichonephila clavipes]|nr:hypothetical protein TNCV_1999181 [Trichonephila clavipes]
MKNWCTTTIQAKKVDCQHPEDQQDERYQDGASLYLIRLSLNYLLGVPEKGEFNSTIYSNMLIKVSDSIKKQEKKSPEGRWFSFIKIAPGRMLKRWPAARSTHLNEI